MGKTNPLNDDDLAEFLDLAASKPESEKNWSVKIAELPTETWGLTVSNPNKVEEVDNRTPAEIISEIEQLELKLPRRCKQSRRF